MHDLRAVAGDLEVDLAGREVDDYGCRIIAVAEGTDWGAREPLTRVLTSWLRHGSIQVDHGSDNRKPVVNFVIEGPNLAAIARTYEALQRDFAGGPMLLEWTPDDPTVETCVFEVVWSSLTHKFDHMEGRLQRRGFTWEFDALPYVRGTELQATTLTVSRTVLSDCSSLDGWTFYPTNPSGALVLDTDKIEIDTWPTDHWLVYNATPGPDFFLGAGEYLAIQTVMWWPRQIAVANATGDLFALPHAASVGGWQFFGPMPYDIDVTSTWFTSAGVKGPNQAISTLAIGTGIGSGRQALLTLDSGGSAPTYGSIHIHDTDLGNVLLHTAPAGSGAPQLSPWEDWTVTTATGALGVGSPSGRVWYLKDGTAGKLWGATIPASQYEHSGSAVLWASMVTEDATKTASITWSVESVRNGVALAGGMSGTIRHRFGATSVVEMVSIQEIPVPPTPMGGGDDCYVRVTIGLANNPEADVWLEEAWLCPAGPENATTVLNAGLHSDLWIDPPSIDDPAGSIWVGDDGDRDNAYHAGPLIRYGADAVHTFYPGGTSVFLLSASSTAYFDVAWYQRFSDFVVDQPVIEDPGPVT